jgi:hypothetical protein
LRNAAAGTPGLPNRSAVEDSQGTPDLLVFLELAASHDLAALRGLHRQVGIAV